MPEHNLVVTEIEATGSCGTLTLQLAAGKGSGYPGCHKAHQCKGGVDPSPAPSLPTSAGVSSDVAWFTRSSATDTHNKLTAASCSTAGQHALTLTLAPLQVNMP